MRSQRHARLAVVLATALLTILTALVGVTGSASAAPRPKLKGTPATGHVLTCQVPASLTKATGRTKAKTRIVWKRDAARIKTATKRTYRVKRSDEGRDLSCGVARAGKALLLSAAVEVIEAPRVTDAPSVSASDNLLTCDPGTWANEPELAFSWTRDGSPYGGTSATLVTGPADTGRTFVCLVAGTNASGSSGYVASGPYVAGGSTAPAPTNTEAPINATRPVVTYADDTLTCDPGLWNGNPVLSYEWDRDGSPVIDADDTSLVVGDEDAGHFFTCLVTGTNAAGSSGAAASERVQVPGPVVAPAPTTAPLNTDAPTLTLAADVLTCDPGTWDGDPVLTFAWTRNGSGVADATADTLPVGTADAGATFVCLVTGTNALGSTGGVASAGLTVPGPAGPALPTTPARNLTPPTLTLAADVLTCDPGTWEGDPVLTYAWTRNGSGTGHEDTTLTVEAADAGATYVCLVTGANALGASGAIAADGLTVPGSTVPDPDPATDPPAPTLLDAPELSGITEPGHTLTCSAGSWTGDDLVFAYAWQRGGSPVIGATDDTYVPSVADAGYRINCLVEASAGPTASGYRTSAQVEIVMPPPPAADPAPSITPTGDLTAGSTLTCDRGTWSGHPLGYAYAWTADGVAIADATGTSYDVTVATVGAKIACVVTATNATADTATASNRVVADPTNLTVPAISGTATVGQTLTCLTGTWDTDPDTTFTVTWQRGATTIATGTSYQLAAADAGQQVTCTVVATRGDGATTAVSTPVTPVAAPTAGPVFSGPFSYSAAVLRDGQAVVVGANWSGQLGVGTTTAYVTTPTTMSTAGTPLAGTRIISMALGNTFTLFLGEDHRVYSAGTNGNGELGTGQAIGTSALRPVAVKTTGTAMQGKDIVSIAAGPFHALAIASDGSVFTWGRNSSRQLGTNGTTSSSIPLAVPTTGTPLEGKRVVAASLGDYHSIVLTDSGQVFGWGDNAGGRATAQGCASVCAAPAAVATGGSVLAGRTVTAIASGLSHNLALDATGQVFAWGQDGSGQLGDGTASVTSQVVAVADGPVPVIRISSGLYSSLALTSTGTVLGWGDNSSYQIGQPTMSAVLTPTAIPVAGTPLAGKTVTSIASGIYSSYLWTSAGEAYGLGNNTYRQLGNASSTSAISTPTKMLLP